MTSCVFCEDVRCKTEHLHYHVPNPISGFVIMTGMLISSLNLILTRTNLNFTKIFTKASLILFILVSLLLDIVFYLIVRASTLYSKYNIIHQLFKFEISHNTSLNTLRYTLSLDPKIHNATNLNIILLKIRIYTYKTKTSSFQNSTKAPSAPK